jgi:hypothetical protein
MSIKRERPERMIRDRVVSDRAPRRSDPDGISEADRRGF